MSKSNLARVRATTGELCSLSWDANPNYSPFRHGNEDEIMANIRRKITEIWDSAEELIIPKRWQMESEIVIPLESWADADPTIIPFWYGIKPEKKTMWKSFKKLFR